MLIYLYLIVLVVAGYWVIKTLGPEMAKPPLPNPKKVPKVQVQNLKKIIPGPAPSSVPSTSEPMDKRIEKLEILLEEKNKNIVLMQKDLRALLMQVNSFEKLKRILDEENHRLREQNRIFRSELGLPTDQQKENSIT